MKPSQLPAAMDAAAAANVCPIILGPPGIGKSQIVAQWATGRGMEVIDLRASQLDPVDLRGIPMPRYGRTEWYPPSFLPRTSGHVLFLDELPQSAPAVQCALSQLILDRRIGDYTLPDGCYLVAAGNRQADRAGAARILSHLASRVLWLHLEPDHEDWHQWALAAGIHPDVLGFLRFDSAALYTFDAREDGPYACPRSWHFVSRLIAAGYSDQEIIAGAIGAGNANKFLAFREVCAKLPDPDKVLTDPDRHPIPDEPSVIFALSSSIVARAKNHLEKAKAACRYAARFPSQEYGVILVRDLLAVNQSNGFKQHLVQSGILSKWAHLLTD